MDEIQVENAEYLYKMAGTNQDKDFPPTRPQEPK